MNNEIVFDIETQNTFNEVNNDFKKFRISVVSIFSYKENSFISFEESEINKLWPYFERASRVIGYNSAHFDIPILNNYYPGNLLDLPHLDLMKEVHDRVGRRLKLNDIAQATLDIEKIADGMQAITWWKEGNISDIKKYCEMDVEITKKIYEFGKANKQLFYKTLKGEVLPFVVNFDFAQNNEDQFEVSQKNINLTLPF
ncbi:MAG: ribonuclease H-like domain-containing protein [bacterium]